MGSYGFALTAPSVNSLLGSRWARWVPGRTRAIVRITGTSLTPAPLFIGIGPTARVSKYLSGVPRDQINHIDLVAGTVAYSHVDGTSIPAAPGKQSFWVAKVAGSGMQTLAWPLTTGDWTVTIMNADGSAPVAATMSIGARFGILIPVVIGLVVGGAVLLAIAATLIVLGARRRRPSPRAAYPPTANRTPRSGPGGRG